jgi:hypothetical protein
MLNYFSLFRPVGLGRVAAPLAFCGRSEFSELENFQVEFALTRDLKKLKGEEQEPRWARLFRLATHFDIFTLI